MNESSKEQVLFENVDFVKKDESKRRSKKKKKQNGSDEPLLGALPTSSPGRNLPFYDEEQGETNPLLVTSPSRAHERPQKQYGAQYSEPENANGCGGYDYRHHGQQPPAQPEPYPPAEMMNTPPNAGVYQYYDQMGAPMYHTHAGQQQAPPPQNMHLHASYNDVGSQRRVRSPHGQSPQNRRSTEVSSPSIQDIRKSYPVVSPDGSAHPLKVSPHVTQGEEEYEIPLRDSAQEQSYGAIQEIVTPSRSSRSKASKPPWRKPETSPHGQRPPSPLTSSHRRVSSDSKFGRHCRTSSDRLHQTNFEPGGNHRRSNSDRLRPKGLGRVRKNLNPCPPNMRRSSSGGALGGRKRPLHVRGSSSVSEVSSNMRRSSSGGALGGWTRPLHVRASSSVSEVSLGASVATSTSMVSHVTDISKSAFFGGTTATGNVQLHFPFENVRLTMDDALPTGVLYMRHVDEDQYEDYHIMNDEHSVPWDLDELPCHCTCLKCIGCTERNQQLAPSHYIMTIEDDLYRRIFDEISASRSMPCGLFFCGHHEDVNQPSILIAGTIVALFMGALVVATIMTNA